MKLKHNWNVFLVHVIIPIVNPYFPFIPSYLVLFFSSIFSILVHERDEIEKYECE